MPRDIINKEEFCALGVFFVKTVAAGRLPEYSWQNWIAGNSRCLQRVSNIEHSDKAKKHISDFYTEMLRCVLDPVRILTKDSIASYMKEHFKFERITKFVSRDGRDELYDLDFDGTDAPNYAQYLALEEYGGFDTRAIRAFYCKRQRVYWASGPFKLPDSLFAKQIEVTRSSSNPLHALYTGATPAQKALKKVMGFLIGREFEGWSDENIKRYFENFYATYLQKSTLDRFLKYSLDQLKKDHNHRDGVYQVTKRQCFSTVAAIPHARQGGAGRLPPVSSSAAPFSSAAASSSARMVSSLPVASSLPAAPSSVTSIPYARQGGAGRNLRRRLLPASSSARMVSSLSAAPSSSAAASSGASLPPLPAGLQAPPVQSGISGAGYAPSQVADDGTGLLLGSLNPPAVSAPLLLGEPPPLLQSASFQLPRAEGGLAAPAILRGGSSTAAGVGVAHGSGAVPTVPPAELSLELPRGDELDDLLLGYRP